LDKIAKAMVKITEQRSNDWLANAHTNLVAWWLPKSAIIAGLFAAVPLRAAVWTVALLWMGVACILIARRCGRTHCRYTGRPYYLAMILPVLILTFDLISASIYTWLALALVIICGGWIIWWTTEQLWGRYSNA
jgi:hypothetical protein